MDPTLNCQHDVISFGIPSLDRLIGYCCERNGEPARDCYGYSLGSVNSADRDSSATSETATFCIIGPDGTGKSLFSLHLASEYWRRTRHSSQAPRIIYASCDLSYERADRVWRSFWLNRPHSRYQRLPFERNWRRGDDRLLGKLDRSERQERDRTPLVLRRYSPTSERPNLTEYLLSDGPALRDVAFLDLASSTSGDDWAFLHSLIAAMERPARGSPRHMLIIDAVEGLETLVGERDAFGQEQSRRARIAQIVRAASSKCHLTFVVEEPRDGERLPEVFVSDLVLRLRTTTDRDYTRRTVELEKVRGQRHIRGQHDFRIRQEASKTGDEYNPDEPLVGTDQEQMAFIQVFPSLHHLTRENVPVGPPDDHSPSDWRYAAFGIYQLDSILWTARELEYKQDTPDGERAKFERNSPETLELLSYEGGKPPSCLENKEERQLQRIWNDLVGVVPKSFPRRVAGLDRMGLPAGSITTLIGHDSTYKSQLARAFLSQCFRTRTEIWEDGTTLPIVAENCRDPLLGQGVAVLLASFATDRVRQARLLEHHLIRSPKTTGKTNDFQRKGMRDRLIVRSLDPHHLPSAVLVHVIQQLIAEAKQRLHREFEKVDMESGMSTAELARVRRERNARIRFVIDDWSTILAVYPEVRRDPLVLPYLMNYLRREGVTTLIVATQSGGDDERSNDEFEAEIRELRVMADHHINTWHVSFFDERRVAISAQPSPLPGVGVQIRELRPGKHSELAVNRLCEDVDHQDKASPPAETWLSHKAILDRDDAYDLESLVVDPHFELYTGLHKGEPVPVPLEVRLFSEREDIPAFQSYLDEVRDLFRHLFGHDRQRPVLFTHHGTNYDILREISYLKSETRLDHSLVLQVDEFWAESRSELSRQERYLFARTVDRSVGSRSSMNVSAVPIRTEDPFGLFQLSDSLRHRAARQGSVGARSIGPFERASFFDVIGYDLKRAAKRYPQHKVPYSWDFGFLVCNALAWSRAFDEADFRTNRFDSQGARVSQSVRDVWNRLWKISTKSYGIQPSLLETVPYDRTPYPFAHWTWEHRHSDKERDTTTFEYFDITGEAEGETQDERPAPEQFGERPVNWREFLGACSLVAEATNNEFEAFDVDLIATESLACFVLEVWFSEVIQATINDPKNASVKELKASAWWPRSRRDDTKSVSLQDLLRADDAQGFGNLFRRALYRSFLLLGEVLRKEQLRESGLVAESRAASRSAIAARHWYSTATIAMPAGADARGQIVVGLPGHCSVRGDWFLAVARGSRSPRLGERAMDVLCSRRGNIVRLQKGIGLPVRDLFSPNPKVQELRDEYWTSLPFVDDDNVLQQIRYRELRKLGAWDPHDKLGRTEEFRWIWRSTIAQYDEHARVFQRWLIHTLGKWPGWRAPRSPINDLGFAQSKPKDGRYSGFLEYDECLKMDLRRTRGTHRKLCQVNEEDNVRWQLFNESCDGLVETLGRVARRTTEG